MARRRKVLIIGGNTRNQGAFMMTIAAAEAVRVHLDAQPVVDAHFGTGSARSWYGLQPLLGAQRSPVRISGPRWLSSGKAARILPWATEREIAAVVDVSGFVFGDQWVDLDLERRAGYFEHWKKRGVPVYLLPQAFGPFAKTSRPSSRAIGASAITFVRDSQSLAHVDSLEGLSSSTQVFSAPDFTVLAKPERPVSARARALAGGVPIVPNWNVAKRSEKSGDYEATLVAVVDRLTAAGTPFFGLCHEGREDRALLEAVAKKRPALDVLDGLNGLEAKWLIGQSPFILSARFHAIVSALSQGVPALMHGWSHKYQELATEYDASQLLVSPYALDANLEALELLLDPDSRAAVASRIQDRSLIEKSRATDMWETLRADFEQRVAVAQ